MSYVNGIYRLPERMPSATPDPLSMAHVRLCTYLWNVLAYCHDRDEHSAARWQKRAWKTASHLRTMLDPTEAASAISDAARRARKSFAQDLAGAEDWRARRGFEPRFH